MCGLPIAPTRYIVIFTQVCMHNGYQTPVSNFILTNQLQHTVKMKGLKAFLNNEIFLVDLSLLLLLVFINVSEIKCMYIVHASFNVSLCIFLLLEEKRQFPLLSSPTTALVKGKAGLFISVCTERSSCSFPFFKEKVHSFYWVWYY